MYENFWICQGVSIVTRTHVYSKKQPSPKTWIWIWYLVLLFEYMNQMARTWVSHLTWYLPLLYTWAKNSHKRSTPFFLMLFWVFLYIMGIIFLFNIIFLCSLVWLRTLATIIPQAIWIHGRQGLFSTTLKVVKILSIVQICISLFWYADD